VTTGGARRHWIALDAVFSRTLTTADRGRAREKFGDHLDAVSDVCFQLLLDDLPPELRDTASSLKIALGSAWSDQPRRSPVPPRTERRA
jgi:hypothetical protein